VSVTTIDLRDISTTTRPGAPSRHVEVRHIDPWSVVRVSLLFYLCLFGVIVVAAVLLWLGAAITGVVGNVEDFLQDAGFEDFQFLPGQLFGAFFVGGTVLVAAGTAANFLLASLYNLMVDVVGGIRLAVVDETAADRPPANLTTPLPTARGYSSVG
jgi:hypothetical protein